MASRGIAHEPQPQLLVLARLGQRRRLEHRVGARLGLGEGHDLADVRLVGQQGRPAVDAERDPAVRRRAVLERVEERAELLVHRLERVALEREARSSRSRRWIRIEPPPSSQPLSARSYWSARARPAGSSGDGPIGSPDAVISSASSSGRTPLNGLWVASQRPCSASHWYIGKRLTQT